MTLEIDQSRPNPCSLNPARSKKNDQYLNKYSLLTGNIDSEYLERKHKHNHLHFELNHKAKFYHVTAISLKDWALAVDSSIKHLIRTSAATTTAGFAVPFFSSKSAESRERTYLASRATRGKVVYGMSHLDCFVGRVFSAISVSD